jgi:fatty-acyl-CoA synthase
MFHVMAWGLPYFAPMNGIKIVMPGMQMDGPSLYNQIENENISMAFGVPTIWMQLLGHCRENNLKLNSLKKTLVGGAAVPVSMIKEFDEKHDVTLVQGWGMTEMSPLGTTNILTDEMLSMPKEERYVLQAKAGRPIYGVEIDIRDEEGKSLPHDGKAYGNLVVRGPWILQKYFKAENDAVDENGWFDTGDISSIDKDGYMAIVDRAKDVIKSGGEWISSIDLENATVGHPEIAEACVVGLPHPKWDERPMLFVVTNTGDDIEKQSILDFLNDKVAKWWLPDEIIFLKELPHGATGKLQKFELRKEFKNHYMEK